MQLDAVHQSAKEWVPELERIEEHRGQPAGHRLKGRIHKLFIDVYRDTTAGVEIPKNRSEVVVTQKTGV